MKRYKTIIVLVLVFIGAGSWLIYARSSEPQMAQAQLRIEPPDNIAAFARAYEPRAFTFPRDHGPHPEYQTEWWYYTGNLAAQGRRDALYTT